MKESDIQSLVDNMRIAKDIEIDDNTTEEIRLAKRILFEAECILEES